MTNDRQKSVLNSARDNQAPSKRPSPPQILKTAPARFASARCPCAAGRRSVNIGALYPTTGSMAQIGVGCVSAPSSRSHGE